MIEDPNRLFAAITAWKCTQQNDKICGFRDICAQNDPYYPLWIKKMWKKIELAFIEFKIATQLYNSKIVYSYEMGTDPNNKLIVQLIERAREILHHNSIDSLDLIYPRTSLHDLEYVKQLPI